MTKTRIRALLPIADSVLAMITLMSVPAGSA